MEIDGLSIGDWGLGGSNCDLLCSEPVDLDENGLIWFGDRRAWFGAMHPKAVELQERTRRFAAAVIKLCESLPNTTATIKISQQLIDSSGSTDSNYRATCRARSLNEFIAKIGVAAEEADESKGWLQLLVASNYVTPERARDLIQEADELTAIFVKSRKTALRRKLERERLAEQERESKRRSRLK